MRLVNPRSPQFRFLASLFSIGFFLIVLWKSETVIAQRGATATVFEGARIISGDGAPVVDSAFIVANGRFTAVGRKGQVNVPAGAAHVDLTGKTVMPAIVDAHKHLAVTRDALVDQLQHFAYYGIGVAMSLGQDTGNVAFQVREETIPQCRSIPYRGTWPHRAGTGTHDCSLRRINAVYLRGAQVDRAALRARWTAKASK